MSYELWGYQHQHPFHIIQHNTHKHKHKLKLGMMCIIYLWCTTSCEWLFYFIQRRFGLDTGIYDYVTKDEESTSEKMVICKWNSRFPISRMAYQLIIKSLRTLELQKNGWNCSYSHDFYCFPSTMSQRQFASSHLLIFAVDRLNGRTSISFFTVWKCRVEIQNGYPGNVTTCTIWRQTVISMLEGKESVKGF